MAIPQAIRERAIDELRTRLQSAVDSATAKPPAARTGSTPQDATIDELQRSYEELARRIAALEERSELALQSILDNLKGLERQAVETAVQRANAVVGSVQAAAYGQRGSVFATNNLLLAGNQLLWTFLDPLLRGAGLTSGAGPSLLGILAPIGTLLTGQLALGNRQHVRFISGTAAFAPGTDVVFDTLRDRIADSYWPEFQRRTDVVVRAEPVSIIKFPVAAVVREGVLGIHVARRRDDRTEHVVWVVDLGEDIG